MKTDGPRLRLDPWSPDYGASIAMPEESDEEAVTDLGVEVSVEQWRPLEAEQGPLPAVLAVVDGVRRVEAHMRLEDGKRSLPVCLSTLSAGGMCLKLGQPASLRDALQVWEVRRLLSVLGPNLPPRPELGLPGRLEMRSVEGDLPDALEVDLQSQMRAEESRVAARLCELGVPFVICDGPLQNVHQLGDACVIGYVKSHRRMLLPEALAGVLYALGPGERTPIFRLKAPVGSEAYDRFSWYLRLAQPAANESAMAGIVRLEAQAVVGLEAARLRARYAATLLPRLVGGRHRDARSPQNLVPIGALERELRRRMGDAGSIGRRLREALEG